jgi:hypothetical protein
MQPNDERAFIGNYRKLGLLKDNKVLILDEQSNANFYSWDLQDNSLKPLPVEDFFMKKTISFYQVADDLYHRGGLKIKGT